MKNRMNKKSPVAIAFVCLLTAIIGCAGSKQTIKLRTENEIMNVDLAMNNLAAKEGFFKTLLLYAEDSVIIPNEGRLPLIGKASVEKIWEGKSGTTQISWYPYKALASSSGDMGYTFGFWTFKGKDTTTYGNYCTVWHKQKDGS